MQSCNFMIASNMFAVCFDSDGQLRYFVANCSNVLQRFEVGSSYGPIVLLLYTRLE